jgi:signal transduction histidine kinase
MRILSVDDNPENLYLIEKVCHAQGHEVVSVNNGIEALEQLGGGPFDLIISDILMPEMDGFQFCRSVKLDDRWKRIPFIFYTATYTSKEDEALALSLGASRFIVKPVEPEEFVDAMNDVMREGEQLPVPPVKIDDGEILSLYNQALIRKLETKINELEAARIENEREVTARRVAEEKLRHAQKLESIGRLAGGVAHDFNNLLTVIAGYNEMSLAALESGSPLHMYGEEIRRATARAASLTMQLLAFSRKQTISVKPVDMNTVVADAARMLRRMIGEDIELVTKIDATSGHVMADADQMHQVIMNLAVNARDAMSEGGTLIVQTANVDVQGRSVFEEPEPVSGPYVQLTISDTGSGMSQETQEHIFEPFYTTKGVGKGTGLGLSTVYGIVRQSQGWIEVSSKVGQGTSFRIFLPRVEGHFHDDEHRVSVTPVVSQGSETILLVEDDAMVRRLTEEMLRNSGYKVISAGDGTEAVQVLEAHPEKIDLLLSDVIMPGLNGRDLYERLKGIRPTLRVLFTSGYSDNVIAPNGVLDPNVAYLAKPFSRDVLVAKVREVLSKVAEADANAGES